MDISSLVAQLERELEPSVSEWDHKMSDPHRRRTTRYVLQLIAQKLREKDYVVTASLPVA